MKRPLLWILVTALVLVALLATWMTRRSAPHPQARVDTHTVREENERLRQLLARERERRLAAERRIQELGTRLDSLALEWSQSTVDSVSAIVGSGSGYEVSSLLEPVRFAAGSSELTESQRALLAQKAAVLQSERTSRLEVIPHCGGGATPEESRPLCRDRAEAVKEHLVASHGITPSRVLLGSPVDYGRPGGEATGSAYGVEFGLRRGYPVRVLSRPDGAYAYFFPGTEWHRYRDRLDEERRIAPMRMPEGTTDDTTYLGRGFFHVMFVRDGVREFICDLAVSQIDPNRVAVDFRDERDRTRCAP